MRDSNVAAIVNTWWPVNDTQARKTEEARMDFSLAMINCQADLINYHYHAGDMAEDRIPYAMRTLQDLRRRGASV